MTIGALVVGLGQIGLGYDIGNDPEKYVATHSRAFDQHPAFELLAGVDPSPIARELFESASQKPAFASLPEAIQQFKPDVIVIATPTSSHIDDVMAVLDVYLPKAILCEKPIAYDLDDAHRLVGAVEEKGCQFFVNFGRRADPGVLEISRRLESGKMSRPYKGQVYYSKGLFNNASHFINLLQFWLGKVTDYQVIRPGRLWDGRDPEPDFELSFGNCVISFSALREENFSYYSIELFSDTGRLRYDEGGANINWCSVVADEIFEGYSVLSSSGETIPNGLDQVQLNVVNQLNLALAGTANSLCTGVQGLHTQEVIQKIVSEL